MPHCDRIRCHTTSAEQDGDRKCLCDCDTCAGSQLVAAPRAHAPQSSGKWYFVGAGLFAIAGALAWQKDQKPSQATPDPIARSVSKEEAPERAPAPARAQRDEPVEVSLDTRVAKMRLEDVITTLRSGMDDTSEAFTDADHVFTRWAATRMWWDELQKVKEVSAAQVMKDPDRWRGNRVCDSGVVVRIEASNIPTGKIFEGEFVTNGSVIFHTIAVRDTGELVANSQARFCGIVTGTMDYRTRIGGTNKALKVFGMFDLPENRNAKAR